MYMKISRKQQVARPTLRSCGPWGGTVERPVTRLATAGAGPPSGCSHVPLLSLQRCVPQDTGFSSLLLKLLMQMLQWLDSPGAEAGPLQAQLKLFATQYSSRCKISDGEGCGGDRQPAPAGWGPSRLLSTGVTAWLAQMGLCAQVCGPWVGVHVDVPRWCRG